MPHVIPADADKFFIYKTIESKVAYRTRQLWYVISSWIDKFTWRLSVKTASQKPRFIIVGIQTAKDGDQTKNPSIFDHVNLKNAYITLNSDRYPAVDHNLSFSYHEFSRVHGDTALFGVKFFGMDEFITQSNITPSDYKTPYLLFTFDVSKQKEKTQILCCLYPNKGKFHWKCSHQYESICTGYFRQDVVIPVWR